MRFQLSLSILASIAVSSVSATPFGDCSLETGLYRIYNVEKRIYVNRYIREDLSLLPKRIVAVEEDHNRPWVADVNSGKAILKANGAPTGVMDGKVYAILLDYPPAEEWTIKSPKCNDVYTIKNNRGDSWYLDSDKDYEAQVKLGKEQQWRFERLDRDVRDEATSPHNAPHGQVVVTVQY